MSAPWCRFVGDLAELGQALFRRLLTASGKQVVDGTALSGIVPYYDGEFGRGNFIAAVADLKNAPWCRSVEGVLNSGCDIAMPSAQRLTTLRVQDATASNLDDAVADFATSNATTRMCAAAESVVTFSLAVPPLRESQGPMARAMQFKMTAQIFARTEVLHPPRMFRFIYAPV